eukprot:CAMPEP_0118718778 /NCGR_PEP_ID=MMETSP0800-20121206/29004_1 /TAXON_ID=210618 ORGANISM="Striatella unipunctata, Strain CCMP2910" /NCGR_SAMPLE_ID=MMETSP0800 /ASSEMBLY_ACC=CAM_ASM_000638 /LENGTH=249 /DNA_ID=CAMNT_0006625865 /DNA_START=272 /DNA_END=1020 /DNA_ORIENTATION=+
MVLVNDVGGNDVDPKPSIWVCNHVSAMDVFFMLASDRALRGKNRRPLKIIYWQELDNNPVTRALFHMCGFIPVQMAANKAGEANNYDRSSFKTMLKQIKLAFEEGFDVGILPEGQLNPHPTEGLLPVFGGAYSIARMSRRPIKMIAIHGTHQLWHAKHGMEITGNDVKLRCYPPLDGRLYASSDEFAETFKHVVGAFGTTGKDLARDELEGWLDGSTWEKMTTTTTTTTTTASSSSTEETPTTPATPTL